MNSENFRKFCGGCEKLGIAYQSYQAYERDVALPTLKNFVAIADLFDVSLDYLLGRKEL